jgi:predicted nucleic acid-binding protein
MSDEFVDTNVILYLLEDGTKADRAAFILARRPRISVQVLNEAAAVCRRKAGFSWGRTGAFLTDVRALCHVEPLTLPTHETGIALATRYGFSIYDSMILAAALIAGCTTLWSEDMAHGQVVEGLRISNPFA